MPGEKNDGAARVAHQGARGPYGPSQSISADNIDVDKD